MTEPDPLPTLPTLHGLTIDLDVPDSESEWALRSALATTGLPPGSLGQLEELAIWLAGVQSAVPPREFARVRLVVFAGDHGVRTLGVSANLRSDSGAAVDALRDGSGVVNSLADLLRAGVRVVDVSVDTEPGDAASSTGSGARIRRGSGRIDLEDALTAQEVGAALELGARIADEEIDSGADLLVVGDVGIGSTTVAATLVAVLTSTEPVKVVGRGGGIDDATWITKVGAIRDARRRAMPRRHDLDDVLAAVGGADIAALTGFLLRASSRRTPVVLDGVVTCAAGLLAREVDPRAPRWWQVATLTREPAQAIALGRLRLEPLTTSSVDLGQGAGALLGVPYLQAAARVAGNLVTAEPVTAEPPTAEPLAPDVGLDERRPDETSG